MEMETKLMGSSISTWMRVCNTGKLEQYKMFGNIVVVTVTVLRCQVLLPPELTSKKLARLTSPTVISNTVLDQVTAES